MNAWYYKNAEIYFNLHKRVYSVRQRNGKVFAHSKALWVIDPKFVVQQGGRRRVLQEKAKNVHAFVRPAMTFITEEWDIDPDAGMVGVTYNPYKYDSFVTTEGQPVYEASVAMMTIDNQNRPVIKALLSNHGDSENDTNNTTA